MLSLSLLLLLLKINIIYWKETSHCVFNIILFSTFFFLQMNIIYTWLQPLYSSDGYDLPPTYYKVIINCLIIYTNTKYNMTSGNKELGIMNQGVVLIKIKFIPKQL